MQTDNSISVWTTESNKSGSWVYGIGGIIVGGLFLYGWHTSALEPTTSMAALISGGTQVIIVDPRRRVIDIKASSRFGAKKRSIPFNHITDTSIGEVGTLEGGSIRYHVLLTLKDGSEVALFAGYFDGAYDRQAMDARRRRLDEYRQAR
jgi:hypothetical protein